MPSLEAAPRFIKRATARAALREMADNEDD
jgi:hypothetical protein